LAIDGTHPSQSGRQKVADMLLRFFQTDSLASICYLKR
jgi:lysophospholipase L1-like esterase